MKTQPDINPKSGESDLTQWQTGLLPLMKRMITGLSLFFFVATFLQLIYLHLSIERTTPLDPRHAFAKMESQPVTNFEDQMAASQLQAMVDLEAYALQRRHHQANVLLMSRVWARYLGFVTGMILAFIGGVFILGKLETPETELEARSGQTGMTIKSASPGLILASLGVVLMITTIVVHQEIQVTDAKVYTGVYTGGKAQTTESLKPLLPDAPPVNPEDTTE